MTQSKITTPRPAIFTRYGLVTAGLLALRRILLPLAGQVASSKGGGA